ETPLTGALRSLLDEPMYRGSSEILGAVQVSANWVRLEMSGRRPFATRESTPVESYLVRQGERVQLAFVAPRSEGAAPMVNFYATQGLIEMNLTDATRFDLDSGLVGFAALARLPEGTPL